MNIEEGTCMQALNTEKVLQSLKPTYHGEVGNRG
jgi:hypothetical protein